MSKRVYLSYVNGDQKMGLPWISITAMAFLMAEEPMTASEATLFITDGKRDESFDGVYASVWGCMKKMDEAGDLLVSRDGKHYRLSAEGKRKWTNNLQNIDQNVKLASHSDSKHL